jgi:transcriptional regulator with PAS, ATPase and Fis domain
VLITGESGVGKDVLARFIHAHSSRAAERFVALNCAGLADSLLESEVFGHVKGSFTGAYRDKAGCMEQAHRGTIFLDEIGDMGPRMQGMLLRFLETGEIRRVGSDDGRPIHVDVRVISATNRSLYEMVRKGTFREDLYYRIHVVHLEVPPLRKRVDDIRPMLCHWAHEAGRPLTFTDEALVMLERYRWPGNVRELKNVVEQLAALVSGRPVEPADLPRGVVANHPGYAYALEDRRHSVAAQVYEALCSKEMSFWEDVHRLFMNRDLTRSDLQTIIRRGLAASAGSYRGLLRLFGLEQDDYKRLLNFLAAHDCSVDTREFRLTSSGSGTNSVHEARSRALPSVFLDSASVPGDFARSRRARRRA